MDTFGRLYQGQPSGTGPELLYIVPTNFAAILKDIEVINIGSGDGEFTIWITPPSLGIDDEWIWRPATVLAEGDSVCWEGSRTIEEDVGIWAENLTGTLNFILTGMEVDLTPA